MTAELVSSGFSREMSGRAEIAPGELADALEVANRACDLARAEIMPRFRRVEVETKSDGSPVTEADRAAELAIRAVIENAFPDDAILGEEFGATEPGGRLDVEENTSRSETPKAKDPSPRRRWIIDPIDGTLAFVRGIPLFTTLIALVVDDEPVLGVIDHPAADDRIAGYRGGGVYRGGDRLSVSKTAKLDDALVCHGDLYCFDAAELRPVFGRMAQAIPKLRGYADAFGHLLVISGAADGMVDCGLSPWDAAVARALTLEAGGTCWVREREEGRQLDIVIGNEAIVNALGGLF